MRENFCLEIRMKENPLDSMMYSHVVTSSSTYSKTRHLIMEGGGIPGESMIECWVTMGRSPLEESIWVYTRSKKESMICRRNFIEKPPVRMNRIFSEEFPPEKPRCFSTGGEPEKCRGISLGFFSKKNTRFLSGVFFTGESPGLCPLGRP